MVARSKALERLQIDYPIIQGPFGGGLSTLELCSIVSNSGGLGSFGAHHLSAPQILRTVEELKALTRKPFAINLWVSEHDSEVNGLTPQRYDRYFEIFAPLYAELGLPKPLLSEFKWHAFDEQVRAIIEAEPAVFSFVFGIPPSDVLRACRARGLTTVGAATTLAEARALDDAGIDLIVASGFEAGGHRPSFLKRAEDSLTGTFALTQIVAHRVRAPVIAAGGIVDGAGVRAAMMLGADLAQLGTAFLACAESGTTSAHRAMLLSDAAEETTLTRAYTGRLARGIPNRITEAMRDYDGQLAPFPLQSWFASKLRAASTAKQEVAFLSLYAGQSAPNLKHRFARDLMTDLTREL